MALCQRISVLYAKKVPLVAKIGDKGYASLQEAIDAVENQQDVNGNIVPVTIVLQKDTDEKNTIVFYLIFYCFVNCYSI